MIVNVNVKEIRSLTCFSYCVYHPFVQTLKEYKENKKISYKKTEMARYYKNFNPSNFSQVITGTNEIIELININKFDFLYPWSKKKVTQKAEYNLNLKKHGSQHFGPVSDPKMKVEFSRLINLYHSIKTNGYKPRSHALGYFLDDNNGNKVLILTAGHHRVPVMTMLGYKYIPIQLYNMPRTFVNLHEIDNWPFVINNFFKKETAKKIFYKFINDYRVNYK
jgi:hypothetical protein